MRPGVEIGRDATVYCNDGPLGLVRQVVVDAAGGQVTDLIVECASGRELVIPSALIVHADGRTVTLGIGRADLLDNGAATAPYQPEEYEPLQPEPAGGEPAPADAPEAATAIAPPPAPPVPTTDPAELRPFERGILRIPLGGEQLLAERRAVVAREVVVRKTRHYETVQVEEMVRKERVEVRERARADGGGDRADPPEGRRDDETEG